jgi:RNA polymerase sigma factor (sigma-70 family)
VKKDREQLIIDHLPLVQAIAHNTHFSRLPSGMDRDDLIQAGCEGLIQAVDRYDPNKGVFTQYAARRIKGAMIDCIRTMQHGNRGQPLPETMSLDLCTDAIPDTWEHIRPDYIDLWDMVETLDHCAQVVIKHYYKKDLYLHEIGRYLGVSESRASQIKSTAIKQLRERGRLTWIQ